MDSLEKVRDFFRRQKSTVAAVDNFAEQFMEVYGDLKAKDKELLSKCIQQMFRKYYYTSLVPDTYASPANMTNTLIERKFGKGVMALPILKPEYKGEKIKHLHFDVACFQTDNHPFVKDMETFLKVAEEGIPLQEPGILPPKEHGRVKNKVLLSDRHYLNIISLAALEAGLLERIQQDDGKILGKASAKAGEFLDLDEIQKLRLIVDAVAKHFSKIMVNVLPESKDLFSADKIKNLLKKPADFEGLFIQVLKVLGVSDYSDIESFFHDLPFSEEFQLSEKEAEKLGKVFYTLLYYDLYFMTPFGYYLQLIQPDYEGEYIMEEEIYNLLEDVDNFQQARLKLFSGVAASYDLTPLGEALLGKGRKPARTQALGKDFGDDDMLELIEKSGDYFDEGDGLELYYDEDDEEEEEEEDEDYVDDDSGVLARPLRGMRSSGLEDTGERRNGINAARSVVNQATDKRTFVFKVAKYRSKRAARHIEIKGTQTLDDLHELISSVFELEWGHLYSFFMSNKAGDTKTEYCHPQAGGRSAENVIIGHLNLNIKQKFMYLYDYGDEVKFEVELVEFKESKK